SVRVSRRRCAARRQRPSFPTRRSSDLPDAAGGVPQAHRGEAFPSTEDHRWMRRALRVAEQAQFVSSPNPRVGCVLVRDGRWLARSEEHTSELQSRENLVCRLLLEKKKM